MVNLMESPLFYGGARPRFNLANIKTGGAFALQPDGSAFHYLGHSAPGVLRPFTAHCILEKDVFLVLLAMPI